MGLYEQIKDIANQKKVSIARLERDLNLSNGSISKWSTNTPSIDKIEKVASYFNISIDYLLDRESSNVSNTGDDKLKVIASHIDDDVTEDDMEEILNFIEFIKSKNK
ncbi:helix-turn-helix domain-containing protein [Carnobacterium divergens]|uniref:helix-turn-helix domain-containing protein n=1 Tax=Carnobacterium divergens TaxID=2748 RepID=UPI00288E7284|nr:helix-turn-helix transcriptional regulator [Carnobacterium divergens]MDT1997258.1 helix-turn-helix domain-containing protein [Carnobacterium divergens]